MPALKALVVFNEKPEAEFVTYIAFPKVALSVLVGEKTTLLLLGKDDVNVTSHKSPVVGEVPATIEIIPLISVPVIVIVGDEPAAAPAEMEGVDELPNTLLIAPVPLILKLLVGCWDVPLTI